MKAIDRQLAEKYPSAYQEVMSNPLSLLWDNMEPDRKEEVLKGITKNQRCQNG